MRSSRVFIAMLLLAAACGDTDSTDDVDKATDGGDADGATEEGDADAGRAPPANQDEVACIDQSISRLMLLEESAHAGAITEQDSDAEGFDTLIDATAGGLQPSESFVYARFEDDGLQQVDVDDEAAFESVKWHIAFRRYVVRLNSGVSGPGKITAARTAPKTEFDAVEEVPQGLDYRTEQYFTETCDYVSDGSGIGAPASALASFWSYAGCVAMTGNVYVIALDDGRHVKFQVLEYYTPENQVICNETNQVPMPSGAGNFHIRWDFLD